MNRQTTERIMVLLSMAFGITVAALAMLDSDGVGIFAVIGGMVLGFLWVTRAVLTRDSS